MEAVAIYKLIILYMLDRAGGELAMPRISSFLIESGYANFETLLQTYNEIRGNGFVEELQKGEKTFLRITSEGEESLGFFSDQIPDGMKLEVRRYLREAGREIANEESILGEYYRSGFGDFTVHLTIRERSQLSGGQAQPVLAVDLSVPDEEAARTAVQRWKDRSGDIYTYLLTTLLQQPQQ